jgi:hypothetical protein
MERSSLVSPFHDLVLGMQEKRHISSEHMAELHWRAKLLSNPCNKTLNLSFLGKRQQNALFSCELLYKWNLSYFLTITRDS